MSENIQVKINDDFITLGQFLKIVDLVSTGGETKYFLNTNEIFINNTPDNRRGRKLYKGDKVIVLNKEYEIC